METVKRQRSGERGEHLRELAERIVLEAALAREIERSAEWRDGDALGQELPIPTR